MICSKLFEIPFEEIARIVGRSAIAARQLASRARRRVRGVAVVDADLRSRRTVVHAFLAALRDGDFEGRLKVLDPDVVVRAESAQGVREIRGAQNWARGALAFSQHAGSMQAAFVEGTVGIAMAPNGRPLRVVRFVIKEGKIVEADVMINSAWLREPDLAFVD
jgi:RNA polymerase sigma-70 factor (ECF subfamily)